MLLKVENMDPRVRRTLQVLRQALTELLGEKDFYKITVGDITSRAGVNRATFYAHFDDKQALVNFAVQERFQELLDDTLPPEPTFSPDNLHLLTLAVCDFLAAFVDHCAPSERGNRTPVLATQVQTRLYDVLLEWIGQSAPDVTAMAISWMIYGVAFQWAHGKRDLSAAHLADQLLPLLVRSSPASSG